MFRIVYNTHSPSVSWIVNQGGKRQQEKQNKQTKTRVIKSLGQFSTPFFKGEETSYQSMTQEEAQNSFAPNRLTFNSSLLPIWIFPIVYLKMHSG